DARREPVARAIGVGNRFLGRVEGRDGDDGPEDLLLHDARLAVDPRDHRRLEEVAVPDALREIPRTLSAGEDGASLLFRERNVTFDFAKVSVGNERAHFGRSVLGVSDLQLLSARQKAVEELVVDRLLHEQTRSAKADLPLIGEARLNRSGDGLFE